MISTLDLLYVVLTVGLIPLFILLCLVLWRVYKIMDRLEALLDLPESAQKLLLQLQTVPSLLVNHLTNWLSKK